MDEVRFADAEGVEMFSRWWPAEDPRAVVLVSHGASEHSGRYDRFARALVDAGVSVAAVDHRGHGGSTGVGVGMSGPGGGSAVVEDLHQLRAMAAERFGPDLPVFFFGHSLGSLIGLAYLVRHADGLAGAVLCGFPAALDGVAAMGEGLHAMAEAGLRDEPAAGLFDDYNTPFEPARTPFDWLSRDPDEVDRYLADPSCGAGNPLTWGYVIDQFDTVAPAAGQLDRITCPVLVIAGDQDPAAGMGAHATALTAALADAGVTAECRLYEGARHELLNETNRDAVTAELLAWFEEHLPT